MYFYNASGMPVGIKEFFGNFNDEYYAPGADDPWHIPGLSRCSNWIELQIEDLLNYERDPNKGIKSKVDVLHILAWKIGGVNHKLSQCKKEWVLYDKWCDAGKMKGAHWGREIENIDAFAEYIANGINDKKWVGLSDVEIMSDLNQYVKSKDNSVKYIGPVYLITLLYFITNGEYPIYDAQAAKALGALKDEKKIPHKQRSKRDEIKFDSLQDIDISDPHFFEVYNDYIKLIEELSGALYNGDKMRYKCDRYIDRALWVYGHLFNRQRQHKTMKNGKSS